MYIHTSLENIITPNHSNIWILNTVEKLNFLRVKVFQGSILQVTTPLLYTGYFTTNTIILLISFIDILLPVVTDTCENKYETGLKSVPPSPPPSLLAFDKT